MVDHLKNSEHQVSKGIELKGTISTSAIEMITAFKDESPFIYYKESDGYPVVCTLIICIASELKLQYPDCDFCYTTQCVVPENKKPGQNPSTDAAVLLKKTLTDLVPFIVVEYKSRSNAILQQVDPCHLMELIVQVYYVMLYYNIKSVIGCLTDLSSWHAFKFTMNEGGKIRTKAYINLKEEFAGGFGTAEIKNIISMFVQLSVDTADPDC